MMGIAATVAGDPANAVVIDKPDIERPDIDLGFLPTNLTSQCRSLIESYHDLHGYACLPDILWKARLGPFIQAHKEFRRLLHKASMARRAKKSSEGFVLIATKILSLEILSSSFAGWSSIYPEAGSMARAILKRHAERDPMPLIEFYLYPPKYISLNAIATLSPPRDLYRASKPELSSEKRALSYVNAVAHRQDGAPAPVSESELTESWPD
jgi:hypothetical protein